MKIRFLMFITGMAGFIGSLLCAGIAAVRSAYFLLDGHYELAEQELGALMVFALLIWCFRHQLREM